MEASTQSAVAHLHESMSWCQAMLAAAVTSMFVPFQPDGSLGLFKYAALMAALSLVTGFALRTAKNYLNVMRFSILHRRALSVAVGQAIDPAAYPLLVARWVGGVRNFYIHWRSPVSRGDLAKKVLFEFDYIYAFGVLVFLMVLLLSAGPCNSLGVIIIVVGVLLNGLRVYWFTRCSPYLLDASTDPDVEHQL